ncbi:penicillin-binding protein 1C [Gracilinema caldarium DSM 7334]|uniref:peptidoglycan glycosyltransferase n=2 Tax=Gracilinema caldarium TaxID=215591 RepID=F8F3S7_GRAC1|nr:penicillin-binding protein 1C [Gracilinema caldarium DSM 7334]
MYQQLYLHWCQRYWLKHRHHPGYFIVVWASMTGILLMFMLALPDPLFNVPYSPVLYDRRGKLLGAQVSLDGQWRLPSTGPINKKFSIALQVFEDHRFYMHPGIDPLAFVRAAMQNAQKGRIVSGGSTITMQVVRLMRGNRDRTMIEKVVEALLALRLEWTYSKRDILALYSAHAPFGGNVVGLEAASWRWFGHASQDLSWAEAATLAVLPNNPGLVHPGTNRSVLQKKRDALLQKLFNLRYLDRDSYFLALQEPLPGPPKPLPRLAPHLLARAVAENSLPLIESTLDGLLQKRATDTLERYVQQFSKNAVMNGACLILDTRTGEVLAYVGNVFATEEALSYGRAVDIISAPRSSGSLLKPFLYGAMLDSGELMPAELVSDIPTRIGSYNPENFTKSYLGAIPADQALARSLNIPAVRELRTYGVDRFARLLRRLGFTTLFRPGDDYGLPLVLGGAEVTLWDVTSVYAGLARRALFDTAKTAFFPPWYQSDDHKASQSEQRNILKKVVTVASEDQLLSRGAAWLTLNALSMVNRPGEDGAWELFKSSRKVAWKTGTSFGYRDAWAVGTTPEYTIGVWIGNASGEGRAELQGSLTAAVVMWELFSAMPATTWFPRPDADLVPVEVCAISGLPISQNCEASRIDYIPYNAPRKESCHFCVSIPMTIDRTNRVIITADMKDPVVYEKHFVLPPAEEYFYKRWNLTYQGLPPLKPEHQVHSDGNSVPEIAFVNPEASSAIYIPVEIDGKSGRLVCTATHRRASAILFWHLDDTYVGSTKGIHQIEIRPGPGTHILTLVDETGSSLHRSFTILSEP